MSEQTQESPHLRAALEALWRGDLSYRMPAEAAEVATRHNHFLDRLQRMSSEVGRITDEVGCAGRFGGQGQVEGLEGSWKQLLDGVNMMCGTLTTQVREVSRTVHALGCGELSPDVAGEMQDEMLLLKDLLNDLSSRLRRIVGEVTRIAREIGEEGKPGGQIQMEGLAGSWKDLTDSVNRMSGILAGSPRS